MSEEIPSGRPRWEVADVFRLYGEAYSRAHRLPVSHLRVMEDIECCRTAALGGHLEKCGSCGFERPAYDSCRNRHCPKCGSVARARWLLARRAELLPVAYFHAVFTLPHQLNPVVLANVRPLIALLFQATSETLLAFGRNELSGTVGFLAVLHTWDQRLRDHFHVHCLIPGGALAHEPERWVPSPPTFLFRVEPLAAVFRGKFLEGMKKLYADGKLLFPGTTAAHGTSSGFRRLIDELYAQPWVVYCKPPFSGPEKVLDYLGRYCRRVAISNHRLLDVENGHVRFTYRDRAHGDVVRVARLSAEEFIRRFLLHVLPTGLQRIRHYGFLSHRTKKHALARCRELLAAPTPVVVDPVPAEPRQAVLALTGVDIQRCPNCGGPDLRRVRALPPAMGPSVCSPIRAPPRAEQLP